MARTSTIVQWGLDCRGVFSRARRKALSSSSAPLERLEDRRLLSVTLVSANTLGQALGSTDQIAISDNGQWVAFATTASAVDLGVTGVAVGGTSPSLSADGRFVAFTTNSSGFASGAFTDTNGSSNDVYVFDSQAGTYTLASAANGATAAVGSSIQPSISNNGRVV